MAGYAWSLRWSGRFHVVDVNQGRCSVESHQTRALATKALGILNAHEVNNGRPAGRYEVEERER